MGGVPAATLLRLVCLSPAIYLVFPERSPDGDFNIVKFVEMLPKKWTNFTGFRRLKGADFIKSICSECTLERICKDGRQIQNGLGLLKAPPCFPSGRTQAWKHRQGLVCGRSWAAPIRHRAARSLPDPLSPPSACSSLAEFNLCHSEEGQQGATAWLRTSVRRSSPTALHAAQLSPVRVVLMHDFL